MEWFMKQMDSGVFEIQNPYNGRISRISATPDNVTGIVFWSKDFGPFIRGKYGDRLIQKGYHLFFNFTINSTDLLLEPNVPPLSERLEQLAYLSRRFDKRCIHWRFDPICFYRFHGQAMRHNLHDFLLIADAVAACGIRTCITSFMDHYPKIQKRVRSINGFSFLDPPDDQKIDILMKMETILQSRHIRLLTCCEPELMDLLPLHSQIGKSSCISGHLLIEISGERLTIKKDRGQRIQKGCGCQTSVDIGSYTRHPCYHNCLFCYANPKMRPQ
ncbi:MAG: DUF1848 family protein [Deltaproteobacteria bacterium]|nr:DUF1848 family protein [Deltaproteobacteria bacterium]